MSGITFAAVSKAADAPHVEGGFYDARFDAVDIKKDIPSQFGNSDCFEWAFTLLDDEGAVLYDGGEPVEVTGLTSMSTNVKSKTTPKAVRYLKALMTEAEYAEFVEGGGVDASALLGRVVQVEVGIKDSGWPSIFNVLPARKRRASR